MTLTELFSNLSSRGLSLSRRGERLRVAGPVEKIDDDLKLGLDEHRGELLNLLPDHSVEADRQVSELFSWLNRAQPVGYRAEDHPAFWQTFHADLDTAIDSGSLTTMEKVVVDLKSRAAWHFLPHHPAGDAIAYPDHPLLEFDFERDAIRWCESAPAEEVEEAIEKAREEMQQEFQLMFEETL